MLCFVCGQQELQGHFCTMNKIAKRHPQPKPVKSDWPPLPTNEQIEKVKQLYGVKRKS